jgi:hypothetical protein
MRISQTVFISVVIASSFANQGLAEEPSVSYIFPAGGQRGTSVSFRVGGHYLHGNAALEMLGPGVTASPRVRETNTTWFEGPIIPLPASQQTEDYPKDHLGSVHISADAETGIRYWRISTSQGATPARKFIIGALPEVMEEEIEGNPISTVVKLPVTINGRIFPREDMDIWTFPARAGESITCDVNAKSLGSPLEARLEVIDPHGRHLDEAIDRSGADPRLQFKAATDGVYQVRIHDVNAGGLQNYVYRLTITAEPYVNSIFPLGGRRGSKLLLQLAGHGLPVESAEVTLPNDAPKTFTSQLNFDKSGLTPVLLDVDDLPERIESEPNQTTSNLDPIATPAILNGRIGEPGDIDHWEFTAKKDESLNLDLRASRLGSPLDSVLIVLDANGKQLARSDDISGDQTDSRLLFKAPADGVYFLKIHERFASRGGPAFSYRLRVAPPPMPDFSLTFSADALTAVREIAGLSPEEKKKRPQPKPAQLRISAERTGDFQGEIEIAVEDLPSGVTVKGNKIAAKQPRTDLTFTASSTAKIAAGPALIRGTAKINGRDVTRLATLQLPRGEPPLDRVLLAVAIPTPFKAYGEYLLSYAMRGSVFHRRYLLDRGGFKGPLTARLADRQFRHLQGVQGPEIPISPEASEFDYPVTLPPWMEIGRTSRTVVMVSGTLQDADGTEHIVSYSSGEQNDQIIAVISPGLLSVESSRRSLMTQPNGAAELRLLVQRDETLANVPVKVELVVPPHIRGITAEPVIVPAGKSEAVLRIAFGPQPGPFNMPALIRAATLDPKTPHFAEAPLELVSSLSASSAK